MTQWDWGLFVQGAQDAVACSKQAAFEHFQLTDIAAGQRPVKGRVDLVARGSDGNEHFFSARVNWLGL